MKNLKAYLLCRFAEKSANYTSWLESAPLQTVVIDEHLSDWSVPDDAGILITHMHYRWEELSKLRETLNKHRVPILILSDGILEYRNTWEHPDLVDGSIFQPLFGHKLACIGRGQARVVESWGNSGKCEVVGLPRLDSIESSNVRPVNRSGPFRVLVATANTPAFNDSQRQTVVDSLNHIKTWCSEHETIHGRPIEITWRLSDGLDTELAVGDPSIDPEDRPPIGSVIEEMDAVITTPSTMYLESVLRNRPTALLDFHNSPQYVSAAWTISARDQFANVLSELADPPIHKMKFQEQVLHDQLECRSPAKPRMLELIEKMVEEGQQARAEQREVKFPSRMLNDASYGTDQGLQEFDLAELYSENAVFENKDVERLQIELAAAIKRLEQLPLELAEKNRYIVRLMKSLDRSRVRVEDMHNRVVAIRERFGVKPAKPPVEGRDIVGD